MRSNNKKNAPGGFWTRLRRRWKAYWLEAEQFYRDNPGWRGW
jgi:hypothetical protein